MTIPAPSFRCELRRDNGNATVVVDGELEEISAVQLARACLQARDTTGDLTLDLGGLDFVDGTGIKMLATLHEAFERSGHNMTVVNLPRCVQREVKALDLDRVLHIAG